MTENEWLACNRLPILLEEATHRPDITQCRAGRRKLRLFGCACCRHIWSQLTDQRSRHAVEIAEQIADDRATEGVNKGTRAAEEAARAFASFPLNSREYTRSASGALLPDGGGAASAACSVLDNSAGAAIGASVAGVSVEDRNCAAGWQREREQLEFFRDIFGNPFRPATVEPVWLAWHDATIPKLAQAAYDERELPSGHLDAKRLAILADALEEAGCTNEDVLAHLRGAGPHVRGCWVVDLLLGRE